jgi:nucleoid-associated protein YgaU
MAATSQTTDQSAIDVRGLVEQVTAGVRREIQQVTAGVRSEIEQMTADFRKNLTAEIERRMAEREPHGHSASTYSRTGGSVNLLARVERDYEMAIDAAFNDLADLTISNTRLWSRLQKFYVDLFECSSRWSLEVQPRIYSETLKGIARDAPSERATMLPTEHRVNPGETLSEIAIRYYGDAREPSWRKIYDSNKEVIGGDPQAIRPGDPIRTGATLNIPA